MPRQKSLLTVIREKSREWPPQASSWASRAGTTAGVEDPDARGTRPLEQDRASFTSGSEAEASWTRPAITAGEGRMISPPHGGRQRAGRLGAPGGVLPLACP